MPFVFRWQKQFDWLRKTDQAETGDDKEPSESEQPAEEEEFRCRICGLKSSEPSYCPECLAQTMEPVEECSDCRDVDLAPIRFLFS